MSGQIVSKKQLMVEDYFSLLFENLVRHDREGIVTWARYSWSYCVLSKDKEKVGSWCSAHILPLVSVQDSRIWNGVTHIQFDISLLC